MGVSESKAHAAGKDDSSQSQRQGAEWLLVNSGHLTNSGKKRGGEGGKCPSQAYVSTGADAMDARQRPDIKKSLLSSPGGGDGQSATETKSSNEGASSGILSEDHEKEDENGDSDSKKRQDEHREESPKIQDTSSCQTPKKKKKKKTKAKSRGDGMEHPSQGRERASPPSQAGNVIAAPLMTTGTDEEGGTLGQEKPDEKAATKCNQTAKEGLTSVNNDTTDSDQQAEGTLASSLDSTQPLVEGGELPTPSERTTKKDGSIPDGELEADKPLASEPERGSQYHEELKKFPAGDLPNLEYQEK